MGSVAFYVVAHQDDWQLFRGQQAWIDIETGAQIVFVYLTAGDAGRTNGWWEAREVGALESCRLVTGAAPLLRRVLTFNNHPIAICDCSNTTSYFMRLPDGSLNQIRNSNVQVSAIDESTTYSGWDDVCTTLGTILDFERSNAGQNNPWVNAPDFDTTYNPSPPDNSDHVATGNAVKLVTEGSYSRVWWVGYDVQSRVSNLTPFETDRKRKLQLAYTDAILRETTAAGTPVDDWADSKDIYESWLDKNYVRVG
jgi:hypothetical protein